MKYAGLLVMPAGFFLALAALALFPDPGRRTAFVLCGLVVEGMGLVVAVRGHMHSARGESPMIAIPPMLPTLAPAPILCP